MRRYLTVGINAYAGQELSGCVNDARDWADVFQARGFVGTILTDRDGTLAGITAEFREMLAIAKRGDTVVFQFSGHGTWVPDVDGDEADQRDEALVPFDYATAGLLTDDRLYRLVSDNRAAGVKVLIISDSCFSGSVYRAMGVNTPSPLTSPNGQPVRASRPRFMPPVNVLDPALLDAAKRVQHSDRNLSSRTGAALLSACRDDQVAWDAWFGDRPNGAFTRAAIDALLQDAPKSLKAWNANVHDRLKHDQDPQTGGTWWQRNMTRFL